MGLRKRSSPELYPQGFYFETSHKADKASLEFILQPRQTLNLWSSLDILSSRDFRPVPPGSVFDVLIENYKHSLRSVMTLTDWWRKFKLKGSLTFGKLADKIGAASKTRHRWDVAQAEMASPFFTKLLLAISEAQTTTLHSQNTATSSTKARVTEIL